VALFAALSSYSYIDFDYSATGAPNVAMLYARGALWVNGSGVPGNIAVLPDDVVQTRPGAVAYINASRSRVLVLVDRELSRRFRNEELSLPA
jgi:hypothetical protein